MQLFFHENTNDDQFTLDAEESKHLIKVLRKTQGDRVNFTNGKGSLFHCIILDDNPKKAQIRIEENKG